MAGWVERLALVEASQLGRRWQLGRSQAYRRLHAMQRAGWVDHARVWHGRPGCYVTAGRKLNVHTYDHDLAVTELVVERELAGDRTITERELRAAAARGIAPVEAPGLGPIAIGLRREHAPDLVTIDGDGDVVAWEVEQSSKGRERLALILAGYALGAAYREVRYRCLTRQIADVVREAAAAAGASDVVRVEVSS